MDKIYENTISNISTIVIKNLFNKHKDKNKDNVFIKFEDNGCQLGLYDNKIPDGFYKISYNNFDSICHLIFNHIKTFYFTYNINNINNCDVINFIGKGDIDEESI